MNIYPEHPSILRHDSSYFNWGLSRSEAASRGELQPAYQFTTRYIGLQLLLNALVDYCTGAPIRRAIKACLYSIENNRLDTTERRIARVAKVLWHSQAISIYKIIIALGQTIIPEITTFTPLRALYLHAYFSYKISMLKEAPAEYRIDHPGWQDTLIQRCVTRALNNKQEWLSLEAIIAHERWFSILSQFEQTVSLKQRSPKEIYQLMPTIIPKYTKHRHSIYDSFMTDCLVASLYTTNQLLVKKQLFSAEDIQGLDLSYYQAGPKIALLDFIHNHVKISELQNDHILCSFGGMKQRIDKSAETNGIISIKKILEEIAQIDWSAFEETARPSQEELITYCSSWMLDESREADRDQDQWQKNRINEIHSSKLHQLLQIEDTLSVKQQSSLKLFKEQLNRLKQSLVSFELTSLHKLVSKTGIWKYKNQAAVERAFFREA